MATIKKGSSLLKPLTQVSIKKGTKYYKDPITSVVLGTTARKYELLQILAVEGTSTTAAAPHPYKILVGTTTKSQKEVWVNQSDITVIKTGDTNSYNSDSSWKAQQQSYEAPSDTTSSNNITGSVGSDHYNILIEDPTPASGKKKSAFTLSDKGRKMFNDDEQIKKIIENMGIVNRENTSESSIRLYHKFDRNGCVDPYNGFVGAKSYTFFTRPDLHIFKSIDSTELNPELMATSFFADVKDRYIDILQTMQSSHFKNTSPFITLLSNTISSPVELPSILANRNIETGTNAFGTTITYRGTSHPSDEALSFSTEFIDNRYLEVFMYFKIFDEYEKQKLLGRVTPVTRRYIHDKILSDQISIFRIDVAEDGESILYFAKWTGCFPTNVPTDTLSSIEDLSGNLTLNIQWYAQFFEDFDMRILSDFNSIILRRCPEAFRDGVKDIPLYDPTTGMSNGAWATVPYIAVLKDTTDVKLTRENRLRQLKLKWR